MITIRISSSAKRAIKVLEEQDAKVNTNFGQSLEKIGRRFIRLIELQFSNSTNPYGETWEKGKKLEGKTLVRNGLLQNSFRHQVNVDEIVLGVSGPATQYASALHFGSGPYVIEAKNGKALRFLGRGGQIIYRKRVNHPGFPQRLMLPIRQRGLPSKWLDVVKKELT
jgi:phage gpG-like protein